MVSVVLPCYNSENTIISTLMSVNQQTLQKFELVIINDGSTDRSGSYIDDFVFREGISVKIISRENKGFLQSLVEGIEYSKGEYIARLDADDIWLPEHLKQCYTYLSDNPQSVLVGANAYYINENNEDIGKSHQLEHDTELRRGLLKDNQFIHSSVVFKKEAYLKTVGYLCGNDISAMHIADYNLWVEMSRYGLIANLPDFTLKYRVAPTSMSRSIHKVENYCARKQVMKKAYAFHKSSFLYFLYNILKVDLRIFQYRYLCI